MNLAGGQQAYQTVNIGGQNLLIPSNQIFNAPQTLQITNQGQVMNAAMPVTIGAVKSEGAMQAVQLQGIQGLQNIQGLQGIPCLHQGIQTLQQVFYGY